MTQQPDWKAEREAIRARLEAASKGPYARGIGNDAHKVFDVQDRVIANDVGYADGALFGHSWQDLRRLLERDEENEREKESLNEQILSERRASREYATQLLTEHEKYIVVHLAELALRDQRISELEAAMMRIVKDE